MFCSSFTNFKQVMKPWQTPLNKTPSKAQVESASKNQEDPSREAKFGTFTFQGHVEYTL
jgi:hypothetical protein